jgi:hypothetical protein
VALQKRRIMESYNEPKVFLGMSLLENYKKYGIAELWNYGKN